MLPIWRLQRGWKLAVHDAMWEVESSQRLQALDEVRDQSFALLLSVVLVLARGVAVARQRGPVFLVCRRRSLVTDLAVGRPGRSWFGGVRGLGLGSVWEGSRVDRAAMRIWTQAALPVGVRRLQCCLPEENSLIRVCTGQHTVRGAGGGSPHLTSWYLIINTE